MSEVRHSQAGGQEALETGPPETTESSHAAGPKTTSAVAGISSATSR